MPVYSVSVNVMDDGGGAIWGFTKTEGLRAGEDAEENALRLLAGTLRAVDEARASIETQAGPDLALVAKEQEALEREQRDG